MTSSRLVPYISKSVFQKSSNVLPAFSQLDGVGLSSGGTLPNVLYGQERVFEASQSVGVI